MPDTVKFTARGGARLEDSQNGLWFTSEVSPPQNFQYKGVYTRSYVEAEGVYRLPLRVDMTVSLDAPGFCVMLGDTGRVNFCPLHGGRCLEDIAELQGKPRGFANHMPLNTPVDITVIYNLKSMRILINGEQRYDSVKEKYMKSPVFPVLNAAGFKLRLACGKRTEARVSSISITESETDFEITEQESAPVADNLLALDKKPGFDECIAHLPDDIRAKIVETDAILRAYKPIKFRRSVDKNGNKITYLASDEGVSYMINLPYREHPGRDMLTHTLEWYILFNSKENWGKRKADNLVATLEKLAADDEAFAERIFSYLIDCCGCYGPNCGARSPYTYGGKTRQSCHGKIEFKMAVSEFDDALRLIRAI